MNRAKLQGRIFRVHSALLCYGDLVWAMLFQVCISAGTLALLKAAHMVWPSPLLFSIILLYITFTFSYTELACAIPKAGGVFDYATRGLGKELGFIAGMAQIIEFVFAPPAIAAAIGAYFHIFFPQYAVNSIAIAAYIIFTALNIYGVKAAAAFELIITIFAVFELLLFAGITLAAFSMSATCSTMRFRMDGRVSGHPFHLPSGFSWDWKAWPMWPKKPLTRNAMCCWVLDRHCLH